MVVAPTSTQVFGCNCFQRTGASPLLPPNTCPSACHWLPLTWDRTRKICKIFSLLFCNMMQMVLLEGDGGGGGGAQSTTQNAAQKLRHGKFRWLSQEPLRLKTREVKSFARVTQLKTSKAKIWDLGSQITRFIHFTTMPRWEMKEMKNTSRFQIG